MELFHFSKQSLLLYNFLSSISFGGTRRAEELMKIRFGSRRPPPTIRGGRMDRREDWPQC